MTDAALMDLASRYGWIFVLLVILLRETTPRIIAFFAPARNKRIDAEIADAAETTRHRREMETRQIVAMEKIAENTAANLRISETIQSFFTTVANRLENLERSSEQTSRALAILLDRSDVKPNENENQPDSTPTRRPRGTTRRPN